MSYCKTLLNLIFFLPLFVCGKTPAVYVSVKPEWVSDPGLSKQKPKSRDIKEGYFLSQLEQQINVEKKATYWRVIRDIVSETGVQNASEINISFDPSFQKLDFHSIIVWRNNRPINKLKLNNFKIIADEKDLSRFIYQGTYSAFLILDDVRKGDKIEFSYTLQGRNPIFQDKYASMVYLQEYTYISHYFTSLIASEGRHLKLKYFNKAPLAKTAKSNGLVSYSWESFNLSPLEFEEDVPSWFDICPKVQFTEFNNWAEVAAWAENINQAPNSLTGASAAFVARLRASFGNNKEKLFREAVRFVQDDVRYMGIEMGVYSHRANHPEKVFTQRYGDCKDKALLLVSLLRSLGIEADMALVNTSEREHLTDFLPSPQLFDHAVVRAVYNGKPVWIDATMQYQGGTGFNIYFPNYMKALIVNKGTRSLASIPKYDRGKRIIYEKYEEVSPDVPLELKVKSVFTGYEADDMRENFASKGIGEKEKDYFKYYSDTYPKLKSLDSMRLEDDREKNILTTYEHYSIPNFYTRDSLTGKYEAGFYASEISNEFPTIKTKRNHPLYVGVCNVEHHISIATSSGWNVDKEMQDLDREDYRFHSYHTVVGDTLKLSYEFNFKNSFIPSSRSEQLIEDMKLIRDNYLEYNISYAPDNIPFLANWTLIGATALLFILFIAAGFYWCNMVTQTSYYQRVAIPLGGWLIVVMLALAGNVVNSCMNLLDEKLFDLNTWETNSQRAIYSFYRLYVCVKVFAHVFTISMAVICLFLMAKRRDILPRTISFYYGISAVLVVLIHILSIQMYGNNYTQSNELIYTVIMSFVGLAYFRSSEVVQDTFVVPKIEEEEDEEEYEEVED